MRVAKRYLISGRVQGVGYRFFTEEAARHESIDGWVRNLRDGRVEVEAEGDADAMVRFEERLRRGPISARVDQLDVVERTAASTEAGFRIR
jgi:acylphosphatase